MIRRGGGFVGGLGELWLVADDANRAILEKAFADTFARYEQIAQREAA
jgi:hypothetical protein